MRIAGNGCGAALNWQGPVYEISAVAGMQTDVLCGDLMTHLEAHVEQLRTDPAAGEAEQAAQERMQHEARERIAALQAARLSALVQRRVATTMMRSPWSIGIEYPNQAR